MSGLQGYGVSLRLRYVPSVQVSSKATEGAAAMGCVGVLTLRGIAAGACGDLPQLLLPQPLESVSFQDSAVNQGTPQFNSCFTTYGMTNKQAPGKCSL